MGNYIMEANNMMRELLLTTASLINEIKAGNPIGCTSYNEKGGYYIANSISDVSSLADNVRASDGFIKDGLMVKFRGQTKAQKGDRYRGYRVTLDLTGVYNGPVSIFTRSEQEYKMYFDFEAWNIERVTVTYKPIDPADGDAFDRVYLEPQVIDVNTGDWKPADRSCSVKAKVDMALKNKLKHYDAYVGDVKMFNEEDSAE
jgi:hypothetical protein